jgi:hypothetical protein
MSETVFKIVNQKQFQASISKKARLLKRQGGTGGPYHMAVIYLDRWIQKNFDSSGKMAMGGGGWKPLADSTMRAREKGWGYYKPKTANPQILRHKGFLKSRWKHDFNNRRGIVESYATAKGSTYYYGVAHDEGKGVPERRILPQEKQISKKIKEIFGFWIRSSMK